MEKPHPLSEKLHVLKNVEGEVNAEAIRVLRELDRKFRQYNWYVGLSPMGSTVRNYGTRESDIDCKLVYDSSKTSRFEVIKLAKIISEEVERAHGFQWGRISLAYMVEFNSDKIKKGIVAMGQEHTDALLTIRDLSGIVIGKTSEEYRNIIRSILATLSHEDKRKMVDQIATFCIKEEQLGEEKLARRTGLSQEELTKLWETRRKLWIERINAMWFGR